MALKFKKLSELPSTQDVDIGDKLPLFQPGSLELIDYEDFKDLIRLDVGVPSINQDIVALEAQQIIQDGGILTNAQEILNAEALFLAELADVIGLINDTNADLSSLQNQVNQVQSDQDLTNTKITGVLDQVQDTEDTLSSYITSSIASAQQDILDAEARYFAELAVKQSYIDDAEARILQAESDLTDAEALIQSNLNSINSNITRLTNAEGDIDQAIIDLATADSRLDGLDTLFADLDADLALAEERITDAEAELSTVEGRVTTNEAGIIQTDKLIKLLAYEQDMIAQGSEQRIKTNTAFIEVNSEQILLRATQSDVDVIEGRVTDNEAELIIQAGEISTKVAQTEFDTLEGRVTSAETSITQNADAITLRATKSELDQSISEVLEALTPAVRFQFLNSNDGFTGTNAVLGTNDNYLTFEATAAGAYMEKSGLSIAADDNPVVYVRVKRILGTGWGGKFEWSDDGVTYYNEVLTEPVDLSVYSVARIDLSEVVNWTGTITNIRLYLGEADGDDFEVDVFEIGKQSPQAEQYSALETRVTEAEADIVINANAIALRVTQTTFDLLESRVTDAEAEIVINADNIALKVSQTEFDTLEGRVTDTEASITVNANNIALKVDQTEFNTLESTVSSNTTAISQNATDISLKAAQSDLDLAEGRITDAEAEIIINAGAITQRVTYSEFEVLEDEITLLTASVVQAFSDAASGDGADGKIELYFQDAAPGTANEGDIWFDTDNADAISTWQSGAWASTPASAFGLAVYDIMTGDAREDGKIVVFFQAASPTAEGVGDLWVDTDDSNTLYRWDTQAGAWVEIQEKISNELKGRLTSSETSIIQNANEIQLKATQTDVDAIEGRVTTAESEIVVNANAIALKVDQTEFDTLAGTVSSNSTSISQNATDISLKADQSEVDTLSGTVSSNTTEISQNADAILLKASQSEVDTLSGEVSANTSQISINATEISTKVSQTEFDSLEGQVNDAGGIAERVTVNETEIIQRLNEIKLIAYEMDAVIQGSEKQVRTNKASITVNQEQIQLKVSQSEFDSAESRLTTAETDITQNATEITLRATQADLDTTNGNVSANTSSITQNANEIATKVAQSEFDALEGTVTTNTTNITQNATDISLKASQVQVDGIDTDLTTLEGDYTALDGRVTTAESEISANASAIILRVTQSEYVTKVGDIEGDIGSLETRVTTAESEISANATSITLKVSQIEYDMKVGQIEGNIGANATNITTNASEIQQRLNEIKLAVYELDAIAQGGEQEVRRSQASIQILQDQIVTKVENDEIFSQMTQTAEGFTYEANYQKSNNFDGTIVNGIITDPGTTGWAKGKDGKVAYKGGWIGGWDINNGRLYSEWDGPEEFGFYYKFRMYLSPSADNSQVILVTKQLYEEVIGEDQPAGTEDALFYVNRDGKVMAQDFDFAGGKISGVIDLDPGAEVNWVGLDKVLNNRVNQADFGVNPAGIDNPSTGVWTIRGTAADNAISTGLKTVIKGSFYYDGNVKTLRFNFNAKKDNSKTGGSYTFDNKVQLVIAGQGISTSETITTTSYTGYSIDLDVSGLTPGQIYEYYVNVNSVIESPSNDTGYSAECDTLLRGDYFIKESTVSV